MKTYNIGIVGATGLVGTKILEVLLERDLSLNAIHLFASQKSAGKVVEVHKQKFVVEALHDQAFEGKDLDFVLFSAGKAISLHYAPLAVHSGAVVVDNSSAWRMDETVPLVVAEVNPEDAFQHTGIIANPNCSTIQSVLPLKVLDDCFGLKRVSYTTYQAVSGAGVKGIDDLEQKTAHHFPHAIHENILPHIDVFDEDGYTFEERKMIEETRKILHHEALPVTATTVRVPLLNTHSIAINVSLRNPFELEAVIQALDAFSGIKVVMPYPTSQMANNQDLVLVGRIRRDETLPNGLHLWCVADNIRKGAATNTVQIAELLMK